MPTPATHSPKKMFWLLGGLSVAIAILATAIVAATRDGSFPNGLPLAAATSLFSFGALPLFIGALKNFKHELRRAYILLCVGIVLYGIGQLQFPLFEIVDSTAWINSGGVILPYIFSIACLFFGIRRFGKIVGLKGLWLSPILAFGSAIILAAISGAIIGGNDAVTKQFEVFLAVILLFSVVIALQIRANTAQRYHKALTFLAASLGMLVFTAFHHLGVAFALGEENAYFASGLNLWPTLLAAVLFMRAGAAFASIRLDDIAAPGGTSPIAVITYVASFASNPASIDTPLDALRGITAAQSSSNTPLSNQQETTLANLYKVLEQHLITNEPLQKFTKESLREIVRTRFQFDPNSKSAFWTLFTE